MRQEEKMEYSNIKSYCGLGQQLDCIHLLSADMSTINANRKLTKLATGQALQQVLHGLVVSALLIRTVARGQFSVPALHWVRTRPGLPRVSLSSIRVPVASKLKLCSIHWIILIPLQRRVQERRVVWKRYCNAQCWANCLTQCWANSSTQCCRRANSLLTVLSQPQYWTNLLT